VRGSSAMPTKVAEGDVEICVTAASVSRARRILPPLPPLDITGAAAQTPLMDVRRTGRWTRLDGVRRGKGGRGAPHCLSFECFRTSA